MGIYRLLNSLEHTAHIERMHRPGATADFPLPPAMVPSAVRTIDELEERERGGHGGLIPVAPGAADFIVTSLAPNFRGGRVPERIPGEVWVVGWCAAPCPGLDGMPCIDRAAGDASGRLSSGAAAAPTWRRIPVTCVTSAGVSATRATAGTSRARRPRPGDHVLRARPDHRQARRGRRRWSLHLAFN